MYGKEIRLRRLFSNPKRKLFAVPLDHPVSLGPIEGLEEIAPIASELQSAGADLLIVSKGAVRELAPMLGGTTRLGVHLSASTALDPNSQRKVLVGTVEEAVGLGADLVSTQVNFGVAEEGAMLSDLGTIVDRCRTFGMPLLCMTYVKRPGGASAEAIQHAARAAADLGCDIVKTSYPGSSDALRSLVRTTPVPLLLGGGDRAGDDSSFLTLVDESIRAGVAGLCVGRNVFQRRPVGPLARTIADRLHGTA